MKMKHFQNQKQKQKTLSTKTNHAVREKMAVGNFMKRGEYLQKQWVGGGGGIKESDGETCEPESEGWKEGGQDKFGGKVSGPVGVSSRVQPLWLGKEGEEGGEEGEAGTCLGQQQYRVCID